MGNVYLKYKSFILSMTSFDVLKFERVDTPDNPSNCRYLSSIATENKILGNIHFEFCISNKL